MKRSSRFSLRLPVVMVACAVLLPLAMAGADDSSDAKVKASFDAALHSKEGTAAERLAKAQALASGADGNPSLQITFAEELAGFQRNDMNDLKAALGTLDAGVLKFPDAPERFLLVHDKIDAMTPDDPDGAVAYAKTQWPLAQKADAKLLYWVAMPYLAALHASGDDAGSAVLLQSVWANNLRNVGNWQGDWMAGDLVKSLLNSDRAHRLCLTPS